MKYVRCRLMKLDTKKPVYIRDWVAEPEATLEAVLVREGEFKSKWKIVSIDRGTFMERL